MTMRAYLVRLTIPDNEAFTAARALARLGIGIAAMQRADLWLVEHTAGAEAMLDAAVAATESVVNVNKHRLEIRADGAPCPGEVWIMPRAETRATVIGGRVFDGVQAVSRGTLWRLLDTNGTDIDTAERERATTLFLCNPAFQKALHA